MVTAGTQFGTAAADEKIDPAAFLAAVKAKWDTLVNGYNDAQIHFGNEERLEASEEGGVLKLHLHSLKKPGIKITEVSLRFDPSIQQFFLTIAPEDKSKGENEVRPALSVHEYLYAPTVHQVGEMVGRYADAVEDSIGVFYGSFSQIEIQPPLEDRSAWPDRSAFT